MPAGRPKKPQELVKATMRDSTHMADGRELPTPIGTSRSRTALIPVPPDTLGDRGLTEWEKVWVAGYWLHDEDYHWVNIIARAYDDMQAFRTKIEQDGLIAKGYAGQVVAHPLIAEVRKCEQQIMKCLSMLGFSPSDRARLNIQEVKLQTDLQNLQKRAKENQG